MRTGEIVVLKDGRKARVLYKDRVTTEVTLHDKDELIYRLYSPLEAVSKDWLQRKAKELNVDLKSFTDSDFTGKISENDKFAIMAWRNYKDGISVYGLGKELGYEIALELASDIGNSLD